jgi:transglutaminase-like putative cysteine protease
VIRPAQGDHIAMLEVRTAGPAAGTPGPERVAEEFSRPNPLVNSEDAAVVGLMRKAVGPATDPWARAVAIQQWVADNLRDKNFETSFAPASEVAKSLAGDCSEHSVLTAAMCRAAGIPTRVVVGLVYAETLGGFGFHMWDEVYVNRRWVAIDAAFKQSDVDAVHIKLSDTSLDGVSPFETFLSVVRVANKLSVEPLEIR